MNTITTSNILEEDISELLGIDDMPEAEQVLFINDIGALMLEGALLKYLVVLSDVEQEKLLTWMETEIASERMLSDLMVMHPAFESFLMEEIREFKTDAARVLTKTTE